MQYMTRHAKYARRPFLAWAASLMLHLSLVSAVHAATKVDVPVQALITPAPCTVQLTGLTGGVLDLGSQTSESLSAAGAVVGVLPFAAAGEVLGARKSGHGASGSQHGLITAMGHLCGRLDSLGRFVAVWASR